MPDPRSPSAAKERAERTYIVREEMRYWTEYEVQATSQAAEPVSPADTIRADAGEAIRWYITELSQPNVDKEAHRLEALGCLDVLLAVGERDKATIHELEVKLTGYDEFKAAQTEANNDDDIWEFYSRKTWASLLAWKTRALAAESAGERDGRRIARLTEALIRLVNYLGAVGAAEDDAIHELVRQARAVLAGEEDAGA